MTANQVQIRRDSSTNLDAATPASGELGYDNTNKRLRLGDGTTAGGIIVPNRIDLQNQSFIAAAAGGTANALTLTVSPVPSAYATYQRFVFKAASDNTASATINVNSLGAKTIKKRTTSGVADLTGGEIQQDGVYAVVYDGTNMQLEDYTQAESTQDWELLATATASASATLDFESLITSAHDTYIFVLKNIRPATDAVALYMRTSTDNGATYAATGYTCSATFSASDGSATSTKGSGTTDGVTTAIQITHLNATTVDGRIGNAAAEGYYGIVELINPLNATMNKFVSFRGSHLNPAGAGVFSVGGGQRSATADVDAVRFLMSSGNITSGSIDMYGLRA